MVPGFDVFSRQVDTFFTVVDAPPEPFDLKMTRIVAHVRTPQNEAFSVFFFCPADRFMQQGTRRLHHAEMGEIEIFLVPVAKLNDGFEYEAVFNFISNP